MTGAERIPRALTARVTRILAARGVPRTAASLLLVGAGAAAGAFVSGVSGFAYGLVALSLWSWQVEPGLLAPMVVFGSLVAQLFAVRSLGHGLDWRAAVPLVVGGAVGVALLGYVNLPLFAVILPAAVLPAWLGTRLYRELGGEGCRRTVLGLLLLSGIVQLLSVLFGLRS